MKKSLFIFLFAISSIGFAQQKPPHDPQRKEKVEAMKIAFLSQKLDLTPDEAEKFWPVYNEYEKKREELHKERREETKNMKGNLDSLSDQQLEDFVNGELEFKQKNLDLEKEYQSKFKAVLPIKKVAKFYRAEDMFARLLLQQLSERGRNGHGDRNKGVAPPPPPPDHQDDH